MTDKVPHKLALLEKVKKVGSWEERPAEAEVRFSRNSSGELLRAEPLWSSCWGGKEAAMLR